MNRHLTSHLAAKSEIRQVAASRLADAAADAVDQAMARHWRTILQSIRNPLAYQARHNAHMGLIAAVPAAKASVASSLYRIAAWGHQSARHNLQTSLPLGYLRSATASRFLPESLLEDEGDKQQPGILELILRSLGKAPGEDVDFVSLAGKAFASDAGERKKAFLELLFPPPPKHVVDSIVYAKVQGRTWEQRLEGATRTSATPQQLAEIVGQGVAAGKTQQQIAKDLLPAVDGIRSTARRIARTEGLRVAQTMQVRAWDGLGDMLLGYQVRSVLDERTRDEHRLRNGRCYYKDPEPGQLGLEECPQPPLEADGTIAWNCFLPGQYVGGNVLAVSKAWYAGEAVEIRTASGAELLVTRNHPVFAEDGFALAGQLQEGQYLWSNRGGEEFLGGADKKNRPALIEDVLVACHPLASSKRASALDFYGDGEFIKSEIRVVRTHLGLTAKRDIQQIQQRRHLLLESPNLSLVRGGDLAGASLGGHLRPLGSFGFAGVAGANAHREQAVANDGSRRLQDFGASLLGDAFVDVEFLEAFKVDDSSFLDKIESVRRFHYEGPVYDVETDTGVFLLSKGKGTMALTKNCRCTLSPILAPPDYLDASALKLFRDAESMLVPDPLTYSRWFAGADDRARRLAVGTRRYSAAKELAGGAEPGYEIFVDPDSEGLMSLDGLRSESPAARAQRLARVRDIIHERGEMIRTVQMLGL